MSKEELAEGRGQKDMCHLKKRREGQDANEGRVGERREGQVLRRHTVESILMIPAAAHNG